MAHSQYHAEWAKSGSIPFEIQHYIRMPSLATPIQYSIGNSNTIQYSIRARESGKKNKERVFN